MEQKYIQCSCYADEHTLKFIVDEDIIYVTHFLNNFSFFKRLWFGIKYIFGYKCRYGHFDETILDRKRIKELKIFLEEFYEKKN